MAVKPYGLLNTTLNINFQNISGYADGDDVIMFSPKVDTATSRTGADGYTTVAVGADQTWEVVIKTMDTAKINQQLWNLYNQQQTGVLIIFPMLFKDTLGTDLFDAASAWLTKKPSVQYGRGANIREWTFEASDVFANFGGHQ